MKGIGFFLLGAAAGAGLTWLLTSEEGKKIVAEFKRKIEEFGEEIDESVERMEKDFESMEKSVVNKFS